MEADVFDSNGMSDPLVVSTRELSQALMLWVETHRADHPQPPPVGQGFIKYLTPEDKREEPIWPVGAIGWLVDATGLPERRITSVLRTETQVTTLRVADLLITAIGRPDLMPEVIPNPRWSQERWQRFMAERGCTSE